jgi:predicted dehydrogenase
MENTVIRVGVIGYGYWGPNVVRNFNAVAGAKVTTICDKRTLTFKDFCMGCPDRKVTNDLNEVIDDVDIDVVAVVTPVSTHFDIAKRALLAGKHVFVEKPFTQTKDQASELIEIAEKKNLKIVVDHTFLYTGAVKKIKSLLDSNEFGSVYYYDSSRINLGLVQKDTNVVWDLAPHDFAILRYLIDQKPTAIQAFGKAHVSAQEDIAYIFVYFPDKLVAHFTVSWLSPVKVRTTMIGGEKKMLIWNDVASDEKIKIYDKGVDVNSTELLVSYRSGDMYSPRIDLEEALHAECANFIDSITNNTKIFSDGKMGLDVVKLLEASDKSLKNNGGMVLL